MLYTFLVTTLIISAYWSMAFDEARAQELEQSSRLIVMIEGENTMGAGIIFGRQDDRIYIATANHVVRKGREAGHLKVLFRGLPEKWLEARLLEHFDSDLDLAVISVENAAGHGIDFCGLPVDRLLEAIELKRGDAVYPVGYPGAAPWGMPVAPDRVAQLIGKQITFQSAFISTGHSGGGLLNEQGELIGMIRADQPPFGVAVRFEAILQKLRQWGFPVQLRTATVNVGANFQSAIKARDMNRLERLLDDCAHVSTRDTVGWTPLHEAASQGWTAAVKPLLKAGIDVNAKLINHPDQPPGLTPLHVAAANGFSEVTAVLVASGADVNAQIIHPQIAGRGQTPLHFAVLNGATEVAGILLKNGASVDAMSDYGTPLMITAESEQGSAEMAEILIENGADPDAKGWRTSPLHFASRRNAAGIIGILLKNGADINNQGPMKYTALHYAAKSGSTEAVRLLLEGGAEIDARATPEITPLHVAIKESRVDAVRLLVEAGADVNAISGIGTYSFRNADPMILALDRDRVDIEIVKILLQAGADVNTDEFIKGRLFRIAAQRGPGFTELLIKIDFDILGRTSNGSTLLHICTENGQVELAKFLLRAGADVNARGGSWERSPLHLAALHGHTEIAILLLKAGADVHSRNGTGKTPLHDAVEHPEMVTLLLEAGADVNSADHGRNTPLHLAAEKKMAKSAKLLIAAGADKTAKDRSSLTPKNRARSNEMIALFYPSWLGVQIQDVTQELADYLGLERPSGVLIESIVSDGPADKANLMPKDIILEYNGHPIKSSKELPPLVQRTLVGEKVVLKIMREGKIFIVPVKIGEKTD
jgi:ankyrin repeat protein